MSTKMLIDARHLEETRVALVDGNRVEDFDMETASKRQLKSNIYLAKVTRVEPSLQAAFVDYGGNRHGFLAFSEIHPDYYQIPIEDREALLQEESSALSDYDDGADSEQDPANDDPDGDKGDHGKLDDAKAQNDDSSEEEPEGTPEDENAVHASSSDEDGDVPEAETVSDQEGEDEEKVRAYRRNFRRRYRIQEVIKHGQVLLVQVVKEERGNKGAALTTYLSLAGRYCVFMPNTTHGGGISRKIANATDRKRLKSVMDALDVPAGMGCIIRTAGMKRTKAEIKRDYDYLTRLWEGIRQLTLESMAPALMHEEGNLIKRSIRDLYTRDIDEVLVEGELGYRTAKDFMRMLMPSHARRVQPYKDPVPLFHRYQVEHQLDNMFSPTVQLRSGGYLVINPTEALISVDVNSGRATKQHNIEETALQTNLEAADELARQLRLRDLAGLIVIDFIDMEERGNNRKIERRMKEALNSDRARVQVGRISSFGLMEMSRQRLRPGMLESSTTICPHCGGTGLIRSTESAALYAIRALEEEGVKGSAKQLSLKTAPEVALYILNQKRDILIDLQTRYDMQVYVLSESDISSPNFELIVEQADGSAARVARTSQDPIPAPEAPSKRRVVRNDKDDDDREGRGKRKRRRRRGRRRDEADTNATEPSEVTAQSEEAGAAEDESANQDAKQAKPDEDAPKRRRRRGRRGGRRNQAAREAARSENEQADTHDKSEDNDPAPDADLNGTANDAVQTSSLDLNESDKSISQDEPDEIGTDPEVAKDGTAEQSDASVNIETKRDSAEVSANAEAVDEDADDTESPPPQPAGEARKGWWQRTFNR
ncbi:MAG: Rne/Rng family ribonuclease [Pseudomonadota bacterium]